MQDIITVTDKITLCTGMTSSEFAKANMFQHIKTPGFIAKPVSAPHEAAAPQNATDAPNTTKRDFTFSQWFFEKTIEDEQKILCITGGGFAGITLYDLLNNISQSVSHSICNTPTAEMKEHFHTVLDVVWAMEAANKQGIKLPNTGPLGIIVSPNGDILFLPEILLNRATEMRSKETAAAAIESMRQVILPSEHTFSFSAAAILYTALSGKKAFTAPGAEEITADFLDNNFIPLEYVCAVREDVAKAVNTALMGKLNFRPPLSKLLEVLCVSVEDMFCSELESKTATESALESFTQKQTKTIKRTRFIRKNFTRLTVGALITIALSIGIGTYVKDILNKPTAVGLTPVQTVESFYSALNHLDTEGMEACATKKASKTYVNSVANVFVVSKMRTVYEQTQGFITPAQWIVSACGDNDSVFGITNFTVNGKTADASADWLTVHGREALAEKDGSAQTVTAAFYHLLSDGLDSVTVTKRVDTLTLTFTKGEWTITEITTTETPVLFEKQSVVSDIRSASSKDEDTPFPIPNTEALRAAYEWFPTRAELESAREELIKRYTPLF